jgi:hypothetical protein
LFCVSQLYSYTFFILFLQLGHNVSHDCKIKMNNHIFDLGDLKLRTFSAADGDKEYLFHVCEEIPPIQGDPDACRAGGVGVCEKHSATEAVSYGNYPGAYWVDTEMDEPLLMKFHNGEACTDGGVRTSSIEFICDVNNEVGDLAVTKPATDCAADGVHLQVHTLLACYKQPMGKETMDAHKSSDTVATAFIVIGVLAGLGVLVGMLVFYRRRNERLFHGQIDRTLDKKSQESSQLSAM